MTDLATKAAKLLSDAQTLEAEITKDYVQGAFTDVHWARISSYMHMATHALLMVDLVAKEAIAGDPRS